MKRFLLLLLALSSVTLWAADGPPETVSPPKSDVEYNKLLNEALKELKVINDKATKDFGIGTYAKWNIDQNEGVLKFSDASGAVKVSAPVVIVGSYSATSKSFQWSWANKSIVEKLSKDCLKVKEYGEKHKIKDLTAPKITGEEQDAWAMAALSLKVIGGEAVYRVPQKSGSLFFVLKKIKSAE